VGKFVTSTESKARAIKKWRLSEKYKKYTKSKKYKDATARYWKNKMSVPGNREKDRIRCLKRSRTDSAKLQNREFILKMKYGLSNSDYDQMVKSQGGFCAICGLPPRAGKRLHVDHDHKTSRVRALLCHWCNLLIGNAHESILILYKAADYIERHNRKQINGKSRD
jgi:hypothetical protein